jgi:hypothetical protein
MEFDNATNLDRKFGVRGTKRKGRSPTIAFARSTKALQKSPPPKPFIQALHQFMPTGREMALPKCKTPLAAVRIQDLRSLSV